MAKNTSTDGAPLTPPPGPATTPPITPDKAAEIEFMAGAEIAKHVESLPDDASEAAKKGFASVPKTPDKPEGLRTDGPTLEEYVAKGYKAETYPPTGYAAKPSAPKSKFGAVLSLAVSALKAAHAALQNRTDDQNALDQLETGAHELAAVENAETGHLQRAHGVLGLAINLLANHSVDPKHLQDARTAQAAVALHLPEKPAE